MVFRDMARPDQALYMRYFPLHEQDSLPSAVCQHAEWELRSFFHSCCDDCCKLVTLLHHGAHGQPNNGVPACQERDKDAGARRGRHGPPHAAGAPRRGDYVPCGCRALPRNCSSSVENTS
jgi:hypothetical protein